MIKNIFTICALLLLLASCNSRRYLFTSFHEPASEGLRLLYSKDGYHWKNLDSIFLKPLVGKDKIMRDPSMLQGPDGTFHLVWTTEWKGGNGFGYASSRDLRNWTEQKYIPVMQHESTVVNVWAPELFYDDVNDQFIIIWASTLPFRFDKGAEAEDNNHRMYYTSTKDFKTFSDTRLFIDPGFSVIDAVIVKQSQGKYILVLKDNTRPERNIKVGFGTNALGPYSDISKPFTENFTEGPAIVKVKKGWLIYYDVYQKKKYGASFTKDFKTFASADSQVSVPAGHKHGTILTIDKRTFNYLQNHN